MDFELPEEIRLLRETVRKFVDRELIPIEMHSMDGPELKPEFKTSLEAKARELGLWQLDTPAEFGGQEMDAEVRLCSEDGRQALEGIAEGTDDPLVTGLVLERRCVFASG